MLDSMVTSGERLFDPDWISRKLPKENDIVKYSTERVALMLDI